MKQILSALALLLAFVLLAALPEVAAAGVTDALTLCARVLLPSLFPFFVCSNLFFLLGFSARLSRRLARPAAAVLHLPAAAAGAFLVGVTGGYPAGAQAVGLLYEQGALSRADAERALAVCNQSGPSFIFGVLGGAVFQSPAAGAFLYAIQLLAAILVCRLTGKRGSAPAPAPKRAEAPESFAAAFSQSVSRAGMSAIRICMFLTVFSVVSRYFLLAAAPLLPPDALPAALGILELSAGCAALQSCALAPVWKLCMASGLLSFGGVSVLAQSRAAVQDAGLSGARLLPCKLLQAALSCSLTLLAAPLVHAERWCVPTLAGGAAANAAVQLPLLLCACLLLLFRKMYHSFSGQKRV